MSRDRLRTNLKLMLGTVGLLSTAQRFRQMIVKPEPTEEQLVCQRFARFKQQYEHLFPPSSNYTQPGQKKALLVSFGWPVMELELGLIKSLELAGYVPVVILIDEFVPEIMRKYYQMGAVKEFYLWNEFVASSDLTAAEAILAQYHSTDEFLELEYEGARVGRFAVSTALRRHKLGSLDLQVAQDRQLLVQYLAASMASAMTAHKMVQQIRPDLVLYVDGVYTPAGEIIDVCLANGASAISWDSAHKNNTLMLKRFTLKNREDGPGSVSSETWQMLRTMAWTEAHSKQLHQELYRIYAKGEWFIQCGTQFNKRLVDVDEIRKRLGLDPTKKTVFIFPHILWDASLFFGEDLFDNYEEWLVETVRAACENEQVNWVIKIHPAHVGKNIQDGTYEDPAEVVALRKYISQLPPHIFTIPPESDINTFSLFDMMDYCVTVRGTIGMEAARLGIPVLTAGTGRYDHRGFTFDSESREQYLEKLSHIQELPRLSPAQQELADRFAYGVFMLRPLQLKTVTVEYHDATGINKTRINIKSKEEWYQASDIRAFAQWVTDSNQPIDFLMPFSEVHPPKAVAQPTNYNNNSPSAISRRVQGLINMPAKFLKGATKLD